jgi:predicted nucleic acid-binding protein
VNCTFDTNILVYTLGSQADPRRAMARDLIIRGMRSPSSILLLQSLAEFSNVAIRKLGIGADSVRRRVLAWGNVIPVQAAMEEDVVSALEIVRDHKLAFWDALMCATAIRAGVRYLLTEDLQDGRSLSGMTIVNPFAPENDALTDRMLPR